MNKVQKRKNKSTSFDLTDEYELELLKFAEGRENGRFSKYIKRLIAQDRDGIRNNTPPPQAQMNQIQPDKNREKAKAMSKFI